MWAPFRSAGWSVLAPVVAITAPAPTFAVDYLTTDQVQAVMFPAADRFEAREVTLTAAQLAAVEHALGTPLRRAAWTLRLAWRGPELAGVVVVDDVVGKFERITYAIGLGPDGLIHQVEILSYRESHGQEVRLAAWRRQFVGKGATSPLRVGEDIAGISGATLSCTHVTEGVRRLASVVAELRRTGGLP
jgi:hypothetical protein